MKAVGTRGHSMPQATWEVEVGGTRGSEEDRRWFVLTIPRGDTVGVREDEVTVTSGLTHKQKEQRKQKRGGGATKMMMFMIISAVYSMMFMIVSSKD